MQLFKARYRGGQTQNIIIHESMQTSELIDALRYALNLPEGQIVGFKDRQGLIITPSYILVKPENLSTDIYDVLLKPEHQSSYSQGTGVLGNESPYLNDVRRDNSQISNQGPSQQPQHYNDFLGRSNIHPPIEISAQNHAQTTSNQQPAERQENSQILGRAQPAQQQQVMSSGSTFDRGLNQNLFNGLSALNQQDDEMIAVVRNLPTDSSLTEQVKQKIMEKVHQKDNGVLGALHLYLSDKDLDGFKSRILPKILTYAERLSSATTAGFNRSFDYLSRNTNSAGIRPMTRENGRLRGHAAQHQVATQDKYLPVILELETKSLLDEQTSSLLKTLILEENIDVFRVINSYIARAINDRELSSRLTRLAQQLGTYIERPQSPLPKRKQQLLNYVNNLTSFHFSNYEDIQILNKLIQEENEFILSSFEVFESDKDHENLIDSLTRILDKYKQLGLNSHSNQVHPTAFYSNNQWPTSHKNSQQMSSAGVSTTPASLFSLGNQLPSYPSHQNHFSSSQQRPDTSQGWDSHHLQHVEHPLSHSVRPVRNVSRSDRHAQAYAGHAHNTRNTFAHHQNAQTHNSLHQFKPTTVTNVALIPNYFSSGDEEHQQQPQISRSQQPTPNQAFNFQNQQANQSQNRSAVGGASSHLHMSAQQRQNGQFNFYPSHHGVQVDDFDLGQGYEANAQSIKKNFYGQQHPHMHRSAGAHQRRSGTKHSIDGSDIEQQYLHTHHHGGYDDLRREMDLQKDKLLKNALKQLKKQEEQMIRAQQKHQQQMSRSKVKQKKQSEKNNRDRKKSQGKDAGAKHGKKHAKKQKHIRSNKDISCSDDSDNSAFSGSQDDLDDNEQKISSSDSDLQIDDDSSMERRQASKKHHKSKGHHSKKQKKQVVEILDSSQEDSQNSLSGRSDHNRSSSEQESESDYDQSSGQKAKGRKQDRDIRNKSQKKAAKRSAKDKKDKQITGAEILKIIKSEGIQNKLREENHAIMHYLNFQKDKELREIFQQYSKNQSSSYLISHLLGKTNEYLESLFHEHLSNEECQKVRRMISQRNQDFIKAFKKFQQSLDKTKLFQKIDKILGETHLSPTKPTPVKDISREEKLEPIYQMIVSEFIGQCKQDLIKQEFEDRNEDFLKILEDFLKHNNFLELKTSTMDYFENKAAQGTYKSLKEAINNLHTKGFLTIQDDQLLFQLEMQGDKHLMAAWEAYNILLDGDDLADTLQVLCDIKREQIIALNNQASHEDINSSIQNQYAPAIGNENSQGADLDFRFKNLEDKEEFALRQQVRQEQPDNGSHQYVESQKQLEDPKKQKEMQAMVAKQKETEENLQTQSSHQPQHMPLFKINFMGGTAGGEAANQDEASSQRHNQAQQQNQQVQQPNQNNSSTQQDNNECIFDIDQDQDGASIDGQFKECVDQIAEFQQKILRKYTMLGFIQYHDAPFFHALVNAKDAKMIAVFEVFAQNRNEDDFLENLGLIAQIHGQEEGRDQFERQIEMTQEEQQELLNNQQQSPKEDPELLNDPNQKVLFDHAGQLTEEEYAYAKAQIKDQNKKFLMVIKVFNKNNKSEGFVDSVKKLVAKENK